MTKVIIVIMMSLLSFSTAFRMIIRHRPIYGINRASIVLTHTFQYATTKQTNSDNINSNSVIKKRFLRSKTSTGKNKSDDSDIDSGKEINTSIVSVNNNKFMRGQQVKVEVISFGPLGASVVVVDDNHNSIKYDDLYDIHNGSTDTKNSISDANSDRRIRGLILQREISMFRDKRDGLDVIVGEQLDGFIEKIRDDNKLNISLRPLDRLRIEMVREIILDTIEINNIIPIGDKSTPEEISSYFHGISKRDYKNAVGSLYKDGIVKPGPFETELIPEEKREEMKGIAIANSKKTVNDLRNTYLTKRNDDSTIFVGNLPVSINMKIFEQSIKKRLYSTENIDKVFTSDDIVECRLPLGENDKAKGYGYVQLKDPSFVSLAIEKLKGFEIMGRVVRLDTMNSKDNQSGKKNDESSSSITKKYKGKVWSTNEDQNDSTQSFKKSNAKSTVDIDLEDLMVDEDEVPLKKSINTKSWSPKGAAREDNNNKRGNSRERIRDRDGKSLKKKAAATLYIGNLAYGVSEEILQDHIETLTGKNTISNVRIVTDRDTGRKRGFGYVDVIDKPTAEKVCESFFYTVILRLL